MKKTALVIGATGLLGYGVVRELLDAHYDITAVARGRTHTAPFPASVPVTVCDRTRDDELKQVVGKKRWDLVVDCAAYEPAQVEAAVKIFAKCAGHYFFISSDFVYAYDPAGTYPTRESDPRVSQASGVPAYAVNKVLCENLVLRAYQDEHVPMTILRPTHIVGAGKPLGCDPVLGRAPQLLEYMRAGKPVPVLLEGRMLIQPVYSREVGRCILHLAGNPRTWGHVFNIAGEECVTVAHYYRLIAKALSIPLSITNMSLANFLRENPERSPMCRHRIYDLSHLRTLTNYKHFYSLDEGMVEAIEWMDRQTAAAAAQII